MNDESLWEKADDARWEATDQGYPPGHPQREYHLEILRLNQFDWLREYSPNRYFLFPVR